MGLNCKVCNSIINYADSIFSHIKQQIMKEFSRDIVCIFEKIIVIPEPNNLLLQQNKIYESSYKCFFKSFKNLTI